MLSGFGGDILINSTQIWTCHLQCDSVSSATQRWRTTNHYGKCKQNKAIWS